MIFAIIGLLLVCAMYLAFGICLIIVGKINDSFGKEHKGKNVWE